MATWDCFLFNDELSLLEVRLNELAPVVDHFVLVEATRTHQGRPKAVHFEEHKHHFARYLEKIVHVIVEDLPEVVNHPRTREKRQKAVIHDATKDADADDMCIVGDVDEIPDRDVIQRLSRTIEGPQRLVLRHCVYHANWRVPWDWVDGPKVCRRRDLASDEMAVLMGVEDAVWAYEWDTREPNGGWHLSFLGGADAIRKKFQEYLHVEYNNPADTSELHLRRCQENAVDFRGRYLLEVLRRDTFDPMLERIFAMDPSLFAFPAPRPMLMRRLYQAYARARKYLPPTLVDWSDRHLEWALAIGGLPLLIVNRFADYRYRKTYGSI